jgi:hypothetical protein
MKKTRQHNTDKKNDVKSVPIKEKTEVKSFHDEYYRDMFTLKMNPVSIDYLLKFALEWVEWVIANEHVITRESFFNAKRVHNTTVDRWINRCPELAEASIFVNQILADRREVGAATFKLSEKWISSTHALYSPKFKDLEIWRNEMKIKVSGAGTTLRVIEIEKAQSSDLVPHRKVSDE